MNKMNYEEFKTKLVGEIMGFMPSKYQHCKVNEAKVMKTNEILDAITFLSEDRNISPTFYCNYVYNQYLQTGDFYLTINSFALHVTQEMDKTPYSISILDKLTTENISYRVINTKRNKEWLQNIPHREFLDLSVIYYHALQGEGNPSVVITNELSKRLGCSEEQLFELASKNTPTINPYVVESMTSVIAGLLQEEEFEAGEEMLEELTADKKMMVLTNEQRIFGASAILNDEVLQKVADIINDDLYIFPSSIHECLAVSTESIGVMEALDMVSEINSTQLQPQEYLADTVYLYNRNTHKLRIIASKYLLAC